MEYGLEMNAFNKHASKFNKTTRCHKNHQSNIQQHDQKTCANDVEHLNLKEQRFQHITHK